MVWLYYVFRYLYFFEKGNPQITVASVQSLIELITTEMQSDSTPAEPATNAFFASTMRYIQFQKQKGGAVGEKYEQIKVWLVTDRMTNLVNLRAVDKFLLPKGCELMSVFSLFCRENQTHALPLQFRSIEISDWCKQSLA